MVQATTRIRLLTRIPADYVVNTTGGTMQGGVVTDPGALSVEMKTFYDKTLIHLAGAKLVHDQFGQKRPIPQNGGKVIEFRKFAPLAKATTPLTEGVTPSGKNLEVSTVTATVSQYGDFVTQTDMLELTADLGQSIASYSHGMKQKLAIISALIHEPKLIIMDEPFVGLDPKASHQLKQLMREICDNGGAIFFSTHVLEVAEKLCDKIAIIKGGKLIKAGDTEEVKGDSSLESVFLELEDEKSNETQS